MGSIRIGDYFERPNVDYKQPALFTWKDFYNFRNHVLHVLRRFGSAGPMGEVDLSVDIDDGPSFGAGSVDQPDFFVVDDMYNKHNRLSIVECDPRHISADLINSLSDMTRNFSGWWVSFSLGDSGLFVTSETVLLRGRRFWDCKSVQEIGDRCSRLVDFGPPEPFSESMYPLWIALICGRFNSNTDIPPARSRQWVEVIRSLQEMLKKSKDGHLTSSAYGYVRNDLHPQTRRQFLLRLLTGISGFSANLLKTSRSNLQQDSGLALSESRSREEQVSLATHISSGLEAMADKLDPGETLCWWANVLHGVRLPSDELAQVLKTEMRSGLRHTNPRLQLSSIFGLARLRDSNIAAVVNDALVANPEWSANPALIKWLTKLKTGSITYPDHSMLQPT